MHRAGFPSTAIAREFGKDHTTILYHLRKLGVPRGLGRGYRRPMLHAEAVVIASPGARRPKNSPYDHIFDEPVNPGKSYREYVQEACRKRASARKAKAAPAGGVIAILPPER
jgi:hypothetical protein